MRVYRVVIDARMYGLEHAGIGRYVMNLLREIKKQKPKTKIILLVKKEKLEGVKSELGADFEYWPVKSRHYSLAEQLEIPWVLRKIKPDLVHFPHFNIALFWSGDLVVTIHDLIKHYFRGRETTTHSPWLYWPKYWSYRFLVGLALRRSRLIFTPSRYWRKKLISDFGLDPDKVIVTYEAVDPEFFRLIQQQSSVNLIPTVPQEPFLIYTGSVYPHKNIERLLLALKKIPQLKLAVACSRSVFLDRVTHLVARLGLGSRVVFLGFVADQKLVALYRRALALVQPSLMEGFGLTGLEAMAVGCPVLAARASCLPEIYGPAALYFNPLDPEDIAKKIKRILTDEQLRKKLIKLGGVQVKKYSWHKTAQKTLIGYQKALRLGSKRDEH